MRKTLIAGCLLLFLAACQSDPVVTKEIEFKTPEVPSYLFKNCKHVKASDLPNPETLTNSELSVVIGTLVTRVNKCANDNAAIKRFLDNAKKIYEERK